MKFISLVLFAFVSSISAHADVSCDAYHGQLSFSVGTDGITAQINQKNYAVQAGGATALAQTLGIVSNDATTIHPGVTTLKITKGNPGDLMFTLSDGTERGLPQANLDFLFDIEMMQGKPNFVLRITQGSQPLLSIGAAAMNCVGLF